MDYFGDKTLGGHYGIAYYWVHRKQVRCLDAQGPCKELLARAAQQYSIERQISKWERCFNWLCSSDALHGPWASEHLLCTSTCVKTNKTDTKWSDMNDI